MSFCPSRGPTTRVDVAERNIARLETLIDDLRSSLTDTGTGEVSLARVQSELIIAQADLETRQMMLAQALQQMESLRGSKPTGSRSTCRWASSRSHPTRRPIRARSKTRSWRS
jgi:hypothetical protein